MKQIIHRYFILNKPYNMVSQFVSTHRVALLGDIDFDFPEGTHAVGRLDNNSEGLLILTTNKKVTRLLFQSEEAHKRTYLVQVNNVINEENLLQLRSGVRLRVKGGGYCISAPCEADVIEEPGNLFKSEYKPTAYPPFTWLRMTITEGKYHQVRKMIGAVHHRCKRLIRVAIEDLGLGELDPGGVREMTERDFFEQLKIDNR
jgi:23S rRNA pseudouridine2457 synthase